MNNLKPLKKGRGRPKADIHSKLTRRQEKLVKEHGVIIRNFPKDVFNLMMSLSREVVAETALEGKINKDIYNSWNKFKQNAIKRSPFNEHGYTNLSNIS